jgi:hypothetical protein
MSRMRIGPLRNRSRRRIFTWRMRSVSTSVSWIRPDLKVFYICYRYSYKNIYQTERCNNDATPPARCNDATFPPAQPLFFGLSHAASLVLELFKRLMTLFHMPLPRSSI